MNLTAKILTTLLADSVAFLLLAGMFVLAKPIWNRKNMESRLFRMLFLFSMLNCVGNGISYSLRYQSFDMARPLAMLSCTILEASVLLLLFVWVTYVDYSLYRSRDHLLRAYLIWFIPIAVFVALLIINLPTGIVFYINDQTVFTPRLLYKLIEYTEYFYLIASILVLFRYHRMNGNPRFFKVWSFLAPILIGSFVTDFTSYSLRSLGIAIGLVTLLFSMENYWRFLDETSGFYNAEYLPFIFTFPDTKERFISAVRVETEGDEKTAANALKKATPENSEMIHLAKGEYLLLSDNSKKSVLRMFADILSDAVEDAGLTASTELFVRKKEETPLDFAIRIKTPATNDR